MRKALLAGVAELHSAFAASSEATRNYLECCPTGVRDGMRFCKVETFKWQLYFEPCSRVVKLRIIRKPQVYG